MKAKQKEAFTAVVPFLQDKNLARRSKPQVFTRFSFPLLHPRGSKRKIIAKWRRVLIKTLFFFFFKNTLLE
jgi:hypothetical protein